MGRDKALLPWGSGLLVQEIAGRLADVTGRVVLVGDPAVYGGLGYQCIPDFRPGLGPLSGIEAALSSGLAQDNLTLACDMPDVLSSHLQALLAVTSSDCVVTEDEAGRIHPLCAVYRTACLPSVTAALDEGRLKLLDLVRELRPAVVRYPGVLHNINTVEDLATVR